MGGKMISLAFLIDSSNKLSVEHIYLFSIKRNRRRVHRLNDDQQRELTKDLKDSLPYRRRFQEDREFCVRQRRFEKIFDKLFRSLGTQKSDDHFVWKIIESFLNLVSNNKGELKAKIVSSKKLSIEEQQKIQNELSKDFKSKLNINYEYDPDLIAGLIIQVGSVMIDTSIKTKLKKFLLIKRLL